MLEGPGHREPRQQPVARALIREGRDIRWPDSHASPTPRLTERSSPLQPAANRASSPIPQRPGDRRRRCLRNAGDRRVRPAGLACEPRQAGPAPLPPGFRYVDLTDSATLAAALEGVDVVATTARSQACRRTPHPAPRRSAAEPRRRAEPHDANSARRSRQAQRRCRARVSTRWPRRWVLDDARLAGFLPQFVMRSGSATTVEGAGTEPVAHSVSVLRGGRRRGTRLVPDRGDFRMLAASGVVFVHALSGQNEALLPAAGSPRRSSTSTTCRACWPEPRRRSWRTSYGALITGRWKRSRLCTAFPIRPESGSPGLWPRSCLGWWRSWRRWGTRRRRRPCRCSWRHRFHGGCPLRGSAWTG